MRATDVIMKKRDGGELSHDELKFLISGYVDGSIPEYQISAFTMAVFFKGMTAQETASLTELMLHSGRTINLSSLKGPFVDKHSTGGVGDKTSLILAPIVAACGVQVPMMSGRALGHTGGTLDKLESIKGYRTQLTEAEFCKYIAHTGFAMTGQTSEIVPADKKLYALRDVTATVESIPLITASILSKKVAEGSQALVFDVKSGSGAFMKTQADAEALAQSLVNTGRAMGKKIVGVLTNMSEPLGYTVGNFFEMEESLDCLEGNGAADLMEVTLRLAGWMLVAGGKAKNIDDGIKLCEKALKSGKPRDLFLQNINDQGGSAQNFLALKGKFRSSNKFDLLAPSDGFIAEIDAFKIGLASVHLGVGRSKTTDNVSPDVGLIFSKKCGAKVKKGDTIATVYGKDVASLTAAHPLCQASLKIEATARKPNSLIIKEITALD